MVFSEMKYVSDQFIYILFIRDIKAIIALMFFFNLGGGLNEVLKSSDKA
jgi:hypothetical protein